MTATDLTRHAPGFWKEDAFTLDIEVGGASREDAFTADHYEILRLGLDADEETIERVYRTLASRFHPDTQGTGDAKTFVRIREAYDTLSNPVRRAQYNALRENARASTPFRLQGREFFAGVIGEQNRRLAALCLLYRRRTSTNDSPGVTLLDLEQLTGCTREELTSVLWYLCEKRWAKVGDSAEYSITAEGFDVVESKIEERLEFRVLATACCYGLPHRAAGRLFDQRSPEELALCGATEPLPPPPGPTLLIEDGHDAGEPGHHGSAMPEIDAFKKLGEDRMRVNALGITDSEIMRYSSACGAHGEHRDEAFASLVRRFDLTPAEAAFVGEVLDKCAPFRGVQ